MATASPARKTADDWTARTRDEVGLLLGVRPRQVSEYLARGCPGRQGFYPLPAIIQWLKSNVWKAREPSPDDDLMDGAASPALEKYRMARAQQEEIKLEAMRKNYIPLEDVQTILVEFAAIYKNSHARMIRECGNKAGEIIDETLAEAERRYQQRWGDEAPDASQTGAAS